MRKEFLRARPDSLKFFENLMNKIVDFSKSVQM